MVLWWHCFIWPCCSPTQHEVVYWCFYKRNEYIQVDINAQINVNSKIKVNIHIIFFKNLNINSPSKSTSTICLELNILSHVEYNWKILLKFLFISSALVISLISSVFSCMISTGIWQSCVVKGLKELWNVKFYQLFNHTEDKYIYCKWIDKV